MNRPTLTYSIELPRRVEEILEVDFWVYNHLTAQLLRPMKEAVKFSSSVSVYVSKGAAEIEMNLLSVKVNAPCLVQIKPSEVVQLKFVTDDFDSSFIVMSDKMRDSLLLSLHDSGASPATRLDPVAPVREADVALFNEFYKHIERIGSDTENPNRMQALLHSMLGFYFSTGYHCYADRFSRTDGQAPFRRNPLVDCFLVLVQQNFKDQRQIEYYARKLGVTPKHLSRILKQYTGFTAADWIKNYLLLEAKVMLKSSTLSMGQIAMQLNLPSQSFFAKFFKNATGLTPKQYRNSPD